MIQTNNIFSSNTGLNNPSSNGVKLITGRVTEAVLTLEGVPDAIKKQIGRNIGVGAVFYDLIDRPQKQKSSYSSNLAFPLFPNQSQIPLPNELISIIFLPAFIDSNLGQLESLTSGNSLIGYYFTPINIWRNFHHNIFPPNNAVDNTQANNSNLRTFEEIEAGAYTTNSPLYTPPLKNIDFPEKSFLRDIQPYAGDIIHKGRWGQSIRFGSTITGSINPNPWSSEGEGGSPITIIRNGQNPENINNENLPPLQVEDINNDISSIYLTSTQVLPFSPSSANYSSYTTQVNDAKNPSPPTIYNGNQIILTSNRLFFNASEDSILLSSKESINLNTLSSINFESKKGIILSPGKGDSSKIYLGGITAQDTVIKGNKFLDDFDQLLSQIRSLAKALQSDIGSSVPNVPNPMVAPAAKLLELHVNDMARDMENYKSKTTRII